MKNLLIIKTTKAVIIFFMLIVLSFLQGCMFYYKVQTVNKITPQDIKKYASLNKYLILHQGYSARHVSEISFNELGLAGNLSVLPDNHFNYLNIDQTGGIRYKRKNRMNVLNEVHLYLQDSLVPKIDSVDHIMIAFSAIKKAEVYKKAIGRTTASWLVPPFLVTIAGFVLVSASLDNFMKGMNGKP
jgi:hypothetical protein